MLCHLLLAPPLVTSQLLPADSVLRSASGRARRGKIDDCSGYTLRAGVRRESNNRPTICAIEQERDGAIYKLHGAVEIYYENYVLKSDEATFNSDTNEATASGHFALDGGPNDDHIRASHGTYNFALETGKFYDVTGTYRTALPAPTGQFSLPLLLLRSPAKLVEKTTPGSLSGLRRHDYYLRVAASQVAV